MTGREDADRRAADRGQQLHRKDAGRRTADAEEFPETIPAVWGRADLHIHSSASDGLADVPAILDHVEQHTALDVIAFADHDTMTGSLLARELCARRRHRFEIVPAMEVTTREGHLLALFLEHPVPARRPLEETVEAIHRQGGLAVVAHPTGWLNDSVNRRTLERVLGQPTRAGRPDGLETMNNSLRGRLGREQALELQRRHGLAQTGGSDAHFLSAIGAGLTRFPGRTAEDLRQALIERRTRVEAAFPAGLAETRYSQIALLVWRKVTRRRKFPLPLRGMLRNLRELARG